MIARAGRIALAALGVLVALAYGGLPAGAYAPHVLQFNYDEDDVDDAQPVPRDGGAESRRSPS